MTAPEVGEVAERAAVKHLLLTHRLPFSTDGQLMAEVKERFSGIVELATPGQQIRV
jgi:ribonuclease BN (tRNA processing enzyme)